MILSYKFVKSNNDILNFKNVWYSTNLMATDSKVLHINEKAFVFDFNDNNYFHFVTAQLGEFLYLKTIFPKLAPIIILPASQSGMPQWQEWILNKIYSDFPEHRLTVFSERRNGIMLEDVIVMSNRTNPFFFDIKKNEKVDLLDKKWYYEKIVPPLAAFLKKHIEPLEPNKIYISRRNKSIKCLQDMIFLHFLHQNKVSWDYKARSIDDPNRFISSSLAKFLAAKLNVDQFMAEHPWTLELDSLHRYLSPDEELQVEELFLSYGYKIIQDNTFEEQLGYLMSATEVAFFAGAGSINSIIVPEDAQIKVLNHDTRYAFKMHNEISKINNNNVQLIMNTDAEAEERNFGLFMKLLQESF